MMTDEQFLAMQRQAMNGTAHAVFPRSFWAEVIRREGAIDTEKYGIGICQQKGAPNSTVNGKNTYRRVFIRLRTPYETLTNRPIKDGRDFANRAAIIENWFNCVSSQRNFVLTFEATEVSDEEADAMEQKGGAL